MLYFESESDDPDITLNGIARSQWAANELPKSLVPLGVDWGGVNLTEDYLLGDRRTAPRSSDTKPTGGCAKVPCITSMISLSWNHGR